MPEIYAGTAMAVCALRVVEAVRLSVLLAHRYIVVLLLADSAILYLETVVVLYVINVQAHGLAAATAETVRFLRTAWNAA